MHSGVVKKKTLVVTEYFLYSLTEVLIKSGYDETELLNES